MRMNHHEGHEGGHHTGHVEAGHALTLETAHEDEGVYIKLLLGEKLVRVETPDIKTVEDFIPPLQALQRLTRVESEKDIGARGPSIAAITTNENVGNRALELFMVPFGRDSLDTARDLEDIYPQLLRSTVLFHAEKQGVTNAPRREEEPGRAFHEYKEVDRSELAKKLEEDPTAWDWPFYGEVDATPKYISSIHEVFLKEGQSFLSERYKGRDGEEHSIEHSLDAAVGWLCRRLDQNPEGLLEFKAAFKGSIENQVWKDSGDSYMHKDGTNANHDQGIASIEVQGLAYDALVDAADMYQELGKTEESERLRERALRLKEFVLEKFWVEDERGGYFALGTDRDERGALRTLEVRASNMGHLLSSKILDGDEPELQRKRDAVVETLFSPEMLAASGVRTLSNKEVKFRPGAYHNGTVWFGDNSIIRRGLKRHGYTAQAEDLADRMLAVVEKYKKYPEFARGGDEEEPLLNSHIIDIQSADGRPNRVEQPPQEIQAWTVAAIIAILHERRLPLTTDFSKPAQKMALH